MIVNVSNKNDIPYGVFSSGYIDQFLLHGVTWSSIIEYVASINGKKYNIQEPYDLNLRKLWDSLEHEKINKALQIGIDAKASVDPEFEGILLSSEARPILYVSPDSYLGVDLSNKEGDNIYGKWLTNYRNLIIEGNPDVFYNSYILERLLSVAINFEPLDKYLEMARNGIGIRPLISLLNDKYKIDLPSRETVEEIRAFTVKDYSYKPEEIILQVMKNKIRSVRVRNLNLFRNKVFESFVTGVIQKYDIKSKYSAAEFIRKMNPDERLYSIDRVYDAYLKDPNKNLTPSVYIPTNQEINNIENLQQQGVTDKIPTHSKTNYALVDSRTSKLSLKDDRFVFTVEGKTFPSLAHYIIYQMGTLIESNIFDPYNMIKNQENGTFYRLEESKKYLENNLEQFYENAVTKKLNEAFVQRFQRGYLRDYIKSVGDNNNIRVNDFNVKLYSDLLNQYNNSISYKSVMKLRGEVKNFLDTDDFFIFIQKEMFESFINILMIATPNMNSHSTVKKVYEQFFGNIPGTIHNLLTCPTKLENINIDNLSILNYQIGNLLSDQSLTFLKDKFIQRILNAELLAHKLFKTNIIYMAKFLILEARFRLHNGAFINPNMSYNRINSKEYLALAKVSNAIAVCNDYKVLLKEHVERAFNILNNTFPTINIGVKTSNIQPTNEAFGKIGEQGAIVLENASECDINCRSCSPELEDNDDNDSENEIEGYETDESDGLDDLMYADDLESTNADSMASYIFNNLKPSREVKIYIDEKAKDLYYSKTKNVYRINLYN